MPDTSDREKNLKSIWSLFRREYAFARLSVGLSLAAAVLFGALAYFSTDLFLPFLRMDERFSIAAATAGSFAAFAAFLYVLYERTIAKKLRSIEFVLDEINKIPLDFESARSQAKQRALIEFESNLRRPLVLKSIESAGFDMFDAFRWDMQPRINVLLGRNGYGKTRLLQAAVAAMAKDEERCASFFKPEDDDAYVRLELRRLKPIPNGRSEDGDLEVTERRKRSFTKTVGRMPILAVPDSRFINKSRTDVSAVDDEHRDIRENGAYHFLYQKPYEPIIQNFLYQLCVDYINHKTFDQPAFQLTQDVVKELSGRQFEFWEIESLGQARFSIDVITEGDETSPIPIQNASQGTLSVLAMFGVIYSYLSALYPKISDQTLLAQRAIIFIDEIDAHLHPTWQRKIVTLLRKTFPNVQFVLTAHSPLVVAGCLDGEVAVLQRGDANRFTVYAFEHDFIGWDADQIYRTVFDVEERDESFKTYSALYADRDRLSALITEISARSSRTSAEELTLRDLRDKLYYIDKTQEAQDSKVDTQELEVENQRLRREIERMSRDSNKTSKARPA